MSALFGIVLSVLSIFLILLVLVQRGRGGGLTGALGGMGGSSAFGAKAGDIFTRITIVTATIWIVVCVLAVMWAQNRADRLSTAGSSDLPLNAPAGVSTTDQAADEADADATGSAADSGSESDNAADDAN